MSDRGPRNGPDRSQPEVELRVLRIPKGGKIVVRTLSRAYGGCFTHWVKGRSKYCPGREHCQNHKLERVWKGFAAIEAYDQVGNLWIPAVLEITQALELDLRGLWARGQVWQLDRAPFKDKEKPSAVRGRLLEECDPDTFPPAFDIRPVLLWVFNVEEVHLLDQNPMPARVKLPPSAGPAPVDPAKRQQPPLSAEETREFIRKAQERMKMPSPNGHHEGKPE